MINDLRSCIDFIEHSLGELDRVKVEVDPKYEIAGILHKLGLRGNPHAVIFENVKGHNVPVVAYLLATKERLEKVIERVGSPPYAGILEAVEKARLNPMVPKIVSDAPCKEVIVDKDIDLLKMFPIPTFTEMDAGSYITSGVVCCKDPETGSRNISIHRMCVKGPDKLNIYMAYVRHLGDSYRKAEAMDKPLQVGIAIGVEPVLLIAATSGKSPLTRGLGNDHELKYAGALVERPIELVRCETVDVEVPARSEIVIEGEIPPKVREMEDSISKKGFAFPEIIGYLGPARSVPIVNIKAITHRQNPIYHMINPIPPSEAANRVTSDVTYWSEIKGVAPRQVLTINPIGGVLVIKYRKEIAEDEGIQKDVLIRALSVWKDLNLAIVVDEDINIEDPKQILWAISTRTERDGIFMIPGTRGHELTPKSNEGIITKIGIDATFPFEERQRKKGRRPVFMDVDLSKYLTGKW